MAVKFYGECSGSSGGKYDIWLSVAQNSQSITNNTSNVTVSLLLRRNDGYKDSAYNLTALDNSVRLKVGGSTKVSKALAIDTRGCVTLTLAAWTGDVTHKDDGSLDLSISGSFSMNGTSLSGGSVSGTFACSDIPRASELTFDTVTVQPGGNYEGTITSASDSFTHRLYLTLGDKKLSSFISAGKKSVVGHIPIEWAQLCTDSKYAYINVELRTYRGEVKTGARTYKLKMVIPEEGFLPDFTLSLSKVFKGAPSDWDEYVKGKTDLKVQAENISLKYGATVSAVSVKVGSYSKSVNPAVFELTASGEITVSLTLKDSRGFKVKKSQKISVRDYFEPDIDVADFYRCDENGNPSNNGTSLYLGYKCSFASVNSKNVPEIFAQYRKSGDSSWSGMVKLEQGPVILFKGLLGFESTYEIAFTVTDGICTDGTKVKMVLPVGAVPFNIRKGGKGASFGGYSEKDNELTVNWNLNVKGDLVSEKPVFSLNEENGELLYSNIKYYPCLGLCVLRIRLDAVRNLEPGSNHVIGTVSVSPSMFTPLSFYVANDVQSSLKGGVKSATGEIFIRNSHTIEKGERIYVGGVFFCDYSS